MDFANTHRGHKYYDSDLPQLIKALNRHSAALEEFNKGQDKEPAKKTTYMVVARQAAHSRHLCSQDTSRFGFHAAGDKVYDAAVQACSEEEAIAEFIKMAPVTVPEHFSFKVHSLSTE